MYQFEFPVFDRRRSLDPGRGTQSIGPIATVTAIIPRTIIRDYLPVAAVLALCTILLRLPDFGNPTYHIDEAFYLFFGESMNKGVAPYRDIWDRKPFGLFVIYAALARFGSVFAYQAAAMLFVWATAFTIAAMAMRFAGRVAAASAGAFYIAMLAILAGGGGQSPIFYNLFIAFAGLLALTRLLGEADHQQLRYDLLAMLLCGIALTVKPTALPEGIFFGLVLIVARWRAKGTMRSLALYALKLCAAAVLPTFLILAFFWTRGDLDEYLFATVRSIFLASGQPTRVLVAKSLYSGYLLSIPLCLALASLFILAARATIRGGSAVLVAAFAWGWLVSAIGGFLMVLNPVDHYALPVASVLALASAALFDRAPLGRIVAISAIALMCLISGYPVGQIARASESREGYRIAAHLIDKSAGTGCVFLYDVTPALYRNVKPCPANKFAFPEHLSNQREAGAIGTNPAEALRAVLAEQPSVIALSKEPSVYTPNLTTRVMVESHLSTGYVKVGAVKLRDVVGTQTVVVWQRKPGATQGVSGGGALAKK